MDGVQILMVFVTASNQEEAARISDEVVSSRKAACATIIPTVRSKYWWEGKLVDDQETILILKTTTDRFAELKQAITEVHSYKVPEIIAIPVIDGLPQYLEWIRKETSH